MRGAFAMNEDAQIGIFAKQRPACAGMVEMNVGEQDGLRDQRRKVRETATPRARFPKWMPDQDRELRSGRRIQEEQRRSSAGAPSS